jgi:hypothetical protein
MAEPVFSSAGEHLHFILRRIVERFVGYPLGPRRRRVRRRDLDVNPNLAWNQYVSLIGLAPYEGLTPVQRVAHLAFLYDAEVQNGGHLQYFANSAGRRWRETLDALTVLGAEQQRAILAAAAAKVGACSLSEIDARYRRSGLARANPFGDIDRTWYGVEPTINDLLQRYLDKHFSDFIEIVDDLQR